MPRRDADVKKNNSEIMMLDSILRSLDSSTMTFQSCIRQHSNLKPKQVGIDGLYSVESRAIILVQKLPRENQRHCGAPSCTFEFGVS
jgi:hypothetical protein